MAANATALCARVISISNRLPGQRTSLLRETNNPLSLSVVVPTHRGAKFRD
jgi:hypothetical protein